MDKKKAGIIVLVILVFLVLVIGVSLGINASYQCDTIIITTQWGAENVLSYYGTVLAATGAAIGIYFSIKATHKNYQEDIRMRVLPFIAVTPFVRRAHVNPLALLEESTNETQMGDNAGEYAEYKLEQVYFIITPNGIEVKNKLDNYQKKVLKRAGMVWKTRSTDNETLEYTEYLSIPLEIENVGNGTAVNLRVGFNHNSDRPHKFVRPMMLKQNQTLYIHIFSTAEYDTVNGEYALEFYYEDIYGNRYSQEFPVSFGREEDGREFQNIELVGKQVKCDRGEPYAHT